MDLDRKDWEKTKQKQKQKTSEGKFTSWSSIWFQYIWCSNVLFYRRYESEMEQFTVQGGSIKPY